MRIYKHKHFHKWANANKLRDDSLRKVVDEMEKGLFDADLGGGLYKKRVARRGFGKREGFRTLLVFRKNNKAIFIFGFAKSQCGNINEKETVALKKLASDLLIMKDQQIKKLIELGKLIEVI